MNARSALLISKGKREIRAIGDSCDPSCFVWFACANSKPNAICEGFVLCNGSTRQKINQNLSEIDAEYTENCVKLIQQGVRPEHERTLVQEVYRFIPPATVEEPHKRVTYIGFNMYLMDENGKLHTPEPEPEERSLPNLNIIAKLNEQTYPTTCTKDCPYITCSSWGVPEMQGKLCRNIFLTNEERKQLENLEKRMTDIENYEKESQTPKKEPFTWNVKP